MTTYIHDQVCPTHPEHGICYASDDGVFCPHAEHNTPKQMTKSFWKWPEWDAAKNNPPKSPTNHVAPIAKKPRAISLKKKKDRR